jgi:3-hydroxymyristoyl/3-hydroxydecanoyl-(acyl carrier protein) dehydratase
MSDRLTPHGPGFSFLDKIEIAGDGKSARGEKFLDPAAPYFADHFPGNPLMPGVLLVECAAQAAGALWQQPQAYLAGATGFRFAKPVLPGQTVETMVALEKDFGSLAQFDTTLRVGGVIVAQGKLTLSRQV